MSGTSGKIFNTTDGGLNWVIQTSVGNGLYAIKFPSSNTGYAVGGSYLPNSVIYKTLDSGVNWIYENPSTINCLFDVYFLDDFLGYAVGANGTIIKTANGGISGLNPNLDNVINVSIYPNPAESELEINNLTDGINCNLQIIDLSGNIVISEVISSDKTRLNLCAIANGFYIVQIKCDQVFFSSKLIVSH